MICATGFRETVVFWMDLTVPDWEFLLDHLNDFINLIVNRNLHRISMNLQMTSGSKDKPFVGYSPWLHLRR